MPYLLVNNGHLVFTDYIVCSLCCLQVHTPKAAVDVYCSMQGESVARGRRLGESGGMLKCMLQGAHILLHVFLGGSEEVRNFMTWLYYVDHLIT